MRYSFASSSAAVTGSREPVTAAELDAKEYRMRWLGRAAHAAPGRMMLATLRGDPARGLTEREGQGRTGDAGGTAAGRTSIARA
ncbi:hypothetical protein [Burkholderia pseudomallei]|uniref:hypothetical protein n=1 Tax=Burkholderia pseudomallei TaxID=28450 RepID=UPI0021562145|nr:hypothetical protein [Burkholderia pseudomallei]